MSISVVNTTGKGHITDILLLLLCGATVICIPFATLSIQRTRVLCNLLISMPASSQGCSGKLHDTIINFGDDLNEEILQRAFAHSNDCDVMLSLGSSMSVTPANSLVHLKKKRGAASGLVVVNRQPTEKVSRDDMKRVDHVTGLK